ncbi:hypothetical protein WEI85_44350 [Actinomycetes bacterium KLBMP 9797]
MALVGLPGALMVAALTTLLQTGAGDGYRGRVFGAASALRGAAMLIGTLAAGVLGERLGIVPVIAAQGAGYCAAGLLILALLSRPSPHDQGVPVVVRTT